MSSKTFPTLIYFISMFATGFSVSCIGPALGSMADRAQVSLETISMVFLAKAGGLIISVLVGGKLFEKVNPNRLLSVGLAVSGLSIMLVFRADNLERLIPVIVMMGIGEGILQVTVNTLTLSLHKNRIASVMNALHFTFGLGALITPVFVTVAADQGDFSLAFLGGGLAIIVVGIISLFLPDTEHHIQKNKQPHEKQPYLLIGLLTLIVFVYVGTDASYSGWVYQYSLQQGIGSQLQAGWMTSVFWGSITAGRLGLIPVVKRFHPTKVLLFGAFFALITVIILTFMQGNIVVLWIGSILFGLSLSSMFPTFFTLAEKSFPVTGMITGWFIMGASIGGMMLPWLIGQFFISVGAVVLPGFLSIDIIILIGLLILYKKISRKPV